jgi:hypothetical protein
MLECHVITLKRIACQLGSAYVMDYRSVGFDNPEAYVDLLV